MTAAAAMEYQATGMPYKSNQLVNTEYVNIGAELALKM